MNHVYSLTPKLDIDDIDREASVPTTYIAEDVTVVLSRLRSHIRLGANRSRTLIYVLLTSRLGPVEN